jgi:hypothetical protein
MGNKNIILVGAVIISSALILLLGIGLVNSSKPATLSANSNTKIEILGAKTHDWGEIDINGGIVEKVFQIKNNGESDLVMTNFKTSCMCTETQISINGKDSPVFGMHTKSGWQGTLKPGETADVNVAFDPLFHGPQGTGPITRLVSFNTNDPDNKTVEFRLSGNVVKVKN